MRTKLTLFSILKGKKKLMDVICCPVATITMIEINAITMDSKKENIDLAVASLSPFDCLSLL